MPRSIFQKGMVAFTLLFIIFIMLLHFSFIAKHTEKQAKLFGLRGWCMNTSQGTVRGQMEGELNKVNEM